MTDSMNFGPDWIRNLSSEGSTGGGTSGTKYQLADYRYGREEMLALFDRNIKPPACLTNFKSLYAETTLPPLALLPSNEDERVGWQGRPTSLGGPSRGRGGSLERGGRVTRGRGGYQAYGRPPNYEGGWGNGEPSDWSPRKEFNSRPSSMDNWRRTSRNTDEDDGWRMSAGKGTHDKWNRSSSWRAEGEVEERSGPPERGGRSSWQDSNRGPSTRKSWDDDHLPEWANENPLESGGSFDDRGAFHGSDEEQTEGNVGLKKDGIQKSTSQQHISQKHPPLLTSKSTMSLVRDVAEKEKSENKDPPYSNNEDTISKEKNRSPEKVRKSSISEKDKSLKHSEDGTKERASSVGPQKNHESREPSPKHQRKSEESEFEKLQEELVLKLVVDEEPSLQSQAQSSFELSSGLKPPPNLTVPGQDKWFYQDPQGQMQGPFTNMEMSEWYKAGYFGQDLKVRRQCDERFFLLGELMAMSVGSNPFQSSNRLPALKNDISKMPEGDLLHFQYLSQLAAYKQAQARVMADPWSAIAVQQQELAAQRLIMQQQQVQQDLQYMQQPPTNPLMHMISQMQQANKLPSTSLLDKQPPNMTAGGIDPHLHMHMTNFLSLQNRLPGGIPNHIPAGLPGGVAGPLPPDNIGGMSGLSGAGLGGAGIPIPGIPSGLTGGLALNVPRSSSVEHNTGQDINSLLKQLQQKQQQTQVESLWQQSQFGVPKTANQHQQWPGQVQQEVPMSMWDIQPPSQSPGASQQLPPQQIQQQSQTQKSQDIIKPESSIPEKETSKKPEKSKENKQKDEEKEQKKKKKLEEEQQKKEAEERRKQEQRKLEAEKKAEVEKKKKEEEKIKKQLEKAKKDSEEKRLKELEEKRKLKEQRKLEEEERKKSEEEKRLEEEERMRKEKEQREREKEMREREERQRAEERRQEQISLSKLAPWSQANSTFGMSLADIQKAEKERKAQEAALLAQRLQMEREIQLQQLQQQQPEKPGGLQLGWAKKPIEPRKVKSLAEIQAEEQERLAKEAAEARLRKEKESRETIQLQTTSSIWSGQNLSWSTATSTHSQWSSTSNISGFWDEPPQKPQPKPSNVAKSSSMSTINNSSSKQVQQQKPPQKAKPKKEEASSNTKKNHNNNIDDDFTGWCFKQLSNMSTTVDIPTFVTFLRDIESAFEVREYCKDYLGESNATQQFANNFLEKRRSFKPKNAYKDDMCSPAPALTPSSNYSSEFQEVKGKNKKKQKSKMLKVDARILGFNVTSAPDRINVGDRDYGDNS